jgi:hypothetical protein
MNTRGQAKRNPVRYDLPPPWRNPLGAAAFDSMVDVAAHRDYMALADVTYKVSVTQSFGDGDTKFR